MQAFRWFGSIVSFLAILGLASGKDESKVTKPDYTEFSKLIQKLVAAKIPKMVEDVSGWGQTIPVPEKLRLPRLRTMVRVGNHMELPHGLWRKVKVWMNEPAKDLQINVREFKQLKPKTMRVSLDAGARFGTSVQAEQWQKGLALLGFAGTADVTLNVSLECDVAIEFMAAKFPPELKVDPKVTNLKLDLKDFTLREVSTLRLGKVLEGEQAKQAGNQYKGILQDLVRSAEPMVKDYANEAVAKALKEGKGTFSAGALFKIMNAAPKEKRVAPSTVP